MENYDIDDSVLYHVVFTLNGNPNGAGLWNGRIYISFYVEAINDWK